MSTSHRKTLMKPRAKINKIYLLYLIYFICITVLIAFFLNILNINISLFIKNNDNAQATREVTITTRKIVIPTEEDLQDLEKTCMEVSNYLENLIELKKEINELYEQVCNAEVCSIANRYFNQLEERFNAYQQELSSIEDYISSYEEKYELYLNLISEIPKYSTSHEIMYNDFIERFSPTREIIDSQKLKSVDTQVETEIYDIYVDAKRIADEFFEEYFDLMCHIVYAEAGISKCSFMERCYVANVVENRIASKRFPNTIYGVIYASGQYEPVINGSIKNTPSQEVIAQVEAYLRGHVETEMPSNVVFQALFPQGKGIWKEMSSGHYFCY